jgi:hypothetical protein
MFIVILRSQTLADIGSGDAGYLPVCRMLFDYGTDSGAEGKA